jgi:DNA-directed RNA polymerase specialized sigma24 family protein
VLAEDLAPEMFVAAMRYAHTYRGTGTVGLWLTKIAQRQLHEHAQSNPRGREVFAEDVSIHADALAGLEEQFVAEQLAAGPCLLGCLRVARSRTKRRMRIWQLVRSGL